MVSLGKNIYILALQNSVIRDKLKSLQVSFTVGTTRNEKVIRIHT